MVGEDGEAEEVGGEVLLLWRTGVGEGEVAGAIPRGELLF